LIYFTCKLDLAGMRRAVPLVLGLDGTLAAGGRRFTADGVAAYAAVSGDRNPVHLDDAFARSESAGAALRRGCLVHAMLAASIHVPRPHRLPSSLSGIPLVPN
jgi:acyl dehydratase